MKEKQLKIFAGVFLGLLIVYFISKPRHTGVDLDEFVERIRAIERFWLKKIYEEKTPKSN